ncbi:hypothetical protein LPJ61_005626 [Coemansia biformis]|uniref:Uncharacterized protein n=1 Tax=Coemansia biformis TaxID=1286918 RepID=A0A9W7Y5Z6_9FUNG|nr:hypothetical protein LPJ61_005626 [Coemansia biformis]
MEVDRYKADGTKGRPWMSARRGENFLFLVFYTFIGVIYFLMGVSIILKKDNDPDDLGNSGGAFGSFSFGMAVASDFAAGLLVFGWIWICLYRRQAAIADFKRHPHTNIGIEIMFLITHICFIVSDRVFVSMLPKTIDLYQIMYPLMVTFVLLMAILIIYLLLKCAAKVCSNTPRSEPPA